MSKKAAVLGVGRLLFFIVCWSECVADVIA